MMASISPTRCADLGVGPQTGEIGTVLEAGYGGEMGGSFQPHPLTSTPTMGTPTWDMSLSAPTSQDPLPRLVATNQAASWLNRTATISSPCISPTSAGRVSWRPSTACAGSSTG